MNVSFGAQRCFSKQLSEWLGADNEIVQSIRYNMNQ